MKNKKWTEEEIEILKNNYSKDKKELEGLLNRSWIAIKHKMWKLNLFRGKTSVPFTDSEILLLKENCNLHKDDLLKLFNNRTWDTLRKKIDELNLPRNKKWQYWTEEEMGLLYKYSDNFEKLLKLLHHRTKQMIMLKGNKLGIAFGDWWSKKDLDFLIDNYSFIEAKDIAKILDKSIQSIYNKANRLNLKKLNHIEDIITNQELVYLYLEKNLSMNKIAKLLNVSTSTVSRKLNSLNIKLKSPSERIKGSNNSQWKNKKSDANKHKNWREFVLERDEYTCQACKSNKKKLNVHHIFNKAKYPELKYNISNGITLCEECHLQHFKNSFHKIYGTECNNFNQLKNYIVNSLNINVSETASICADLMLEDFLDINNINV